MMELNHGRVSLWVRTLQERDGVALLPLHALGFPFRLRMRLPLRPVTSSCAELCPSVTFPERSLRSEACPRAGSLESRNECERRRFKRSSPSTFATCWRISSGRA